MREAYARELGNTDAVPAMIATPQTQGDILNWHPHVHAVAAEGAFTETGEFVRLPYVWLQRAEELWRDRVFALLLDTFKIEEQTVASMRSWRHSGFSVDNSVRIEAGDQEGMERLIGYIARCPLSLSRMVSRTEDDRILYRASHARCWPFPKSGEQTVMEGIPRNFEVFEPLDFLAEVTQHIPTVPTTRMCDVGALPPCTAEAKLTIEESTRSATTADTVTQGKRHNEFSPKGWYSSPWGAAATTAGACSARPCRQRQ